MKGICVLVVTALVAAAAGTPECYQDNEGALYPHEDCNRFYQCSNDVAYVLECPEDLLYNEDDRRCDWKKNVDCGSRNTGDGSDSSGGDSSGSGGGDCNCRCDSSNSSGEDNKYFPNGCPRDFEEHKLLPHESKKSSFYQCNFGEKVLKKCPAPGLQFYYDHQTCIWSSSTSSATK